METVTVPVLGCLDFDEAGFAETTLELGGQRIQVDVSLEAGLDVVALEHAAGLMANFARLEEEARKAMREDLASGDDEAVMVLYRAHHLAELEDAVTRDFFDRSAVAPAEDDTFLRALKLARVGIYPKSPEEMIVCDYTIGVEVTNYLVAVAFDSSGSVSAMSLES
jgi:hypothetical protein